MSRSPVPARVVLSTLAVCVAFVAGIAFEHFGREAQAQSSGASTMFVPPGGLVFRTLDGRPIARISDTPKGGNFELYDEHRDVAVRIQAAHPKPVLARENPYSVEERDPWTTGF